ncbi:hypothetical protein DFP72DRAFT_420308 [Ephemerocybe angulata]|uniref:Uncharacterized protein n=1 Tax=Ephemerocybe angulata TaxID=980116 RepID=A0A8H6IG28_9AGAR|nr:hypothetical protein DFP72DRAFT_420308 [Tulosesus angulatus]
MCLFIFLSARSQRPPSPPSLPLGYIFSTFMLRSLAFPSSQSALFTHQRPMRKGERRKATSGVGDSPLTVHAKPSSLMCAVAPSERQVPRCLSLLSPKHVSVEMCCPVQDLQRGTGTQGKATVRSFPPSPLFSLTSPFLRPPFFHLRSPIERKELTLTSYYSHPPSSGQEVQKCDTD